MRILITGATGFVGSHVAVACLRDGWEVGALVLPGEETVCQERFDGEVVAFPGTLAAPPWPDLEAWRAETCIHCAWVATPGEYLQSPLNWDFLEWSKAFLRRLAANGTRRFVGVGSCAERLLPALGAAAPAYARAKDELRQFMLGGMQGASAVWARLFYPYGEGEARERLVSSLIAAFEAGRSFLLKCPGVRKDYIHVDDAAAALAALAGAGTTGTVDVGTGTGTRLGDLATRVAEGFGRPELLVLGEETDPLGDMVADPTPLQGLGWNPGVPLAQGLAEMVSGRRPEAGA